MRQLEVSSGRHVTATTIYRSLAFLLRQGLVMRVESLNAYLPCPNLGTPFVGVFFICDVCGAATGVEDPAVEHLLTKRAKSFGFSARSKTIELQGVCRRCSECH